MTVQHQSLDRISALPQDITEKILTHMPIRDALRTSILSRKWRYSWTRMPKLVFDDTMVDVPSGAIDELEKHKIINAIFHVLLLHRVPILELDIWVFDTKIDNGIDQIILHLSWSKNIKEFIFECAYEGYKLPLSFFSIQGLESLHLINCKIELPLMFNGFSMLKRLFLQNVTITATVLQRLVANCPLLRDFSLTENGKIDFIGGKECIFVDLFTCLPSLRYLNINKFYMEHLAAGGMPQRLPTSLPHLKKLVLEVSFQKQNEFSSLLCLIRSSPNLTLISLKMFYNGEVETINDLPDLQDYSGFNLDHLVELEIKNFHNHALEMEFVKLIMAKSPMLKKARIELDSKVSVDEENKMLRDLVLQPLPRASPSANFIIHRPKN